jgi:prevent-host-death family protein
MTETGVSASHFRVHFKEIANSVARGGHRFTVARHGLEIVALVSLEDLEFLRKHKRGADPVETAQAEPEPETINLIHPDLMPIELVEEAYELSTGSTDPEVIRWRGRAFLSIRARTGKYPQDGPVRWPSG